MSKRDYVTASMTWLAGLSAAVNIAVMFVGAFTADLTAFIVGWIFATVAVCALLVVRADS